MHQKSLPVVTPQPDQTVKLPKSPKQQVKRAGTTFIDLAGNGSELISDGSETVSIRI